MEETDFQDRINPLLECGATVLSLVAPLRKGDRGAGLGGDLREKFYAAFDDMERLALERQIGSPQLRDAKYALCALVDEAVLSSSWPGRLSWMGRPLQLEMFGEHLAGERFFERLSVLRQGGEANADSLELFYICLQLGFEGIYKLRGLEQLTALQVDLRTQIEHYRGVIDPRLSPDGLPKIGLMTRVRREIPYWVIGVFTVAVVFFTYLGYSVAVGRLMRSSVSAMESSRQAILLRAERDAAPMKPVAEQGGER